MKIHLFEMLCCILTKLRQSFPKSSVSTCWRSDSTLLEQRKDISHVLLQRFPFGKWS